MYIFGVHTTFFSSRSALQGLSISDGLGENLGNEPISALLSDFCLDSFTNKLLERNKHSKVIFLFY